MTLLDKTVAKYTAQLTPNGRILAFVDSPYRNGRLSKLNDRLCQLCLAHGDQTQAEFDAMPLWRRACGTLAIVVDNIDSIRSYRRYLKKGKR